MNRPSLSRSLRGSATGLTLVELLVVVAILAIVAGFVIPLIGNYASSSRLTTAKASLGNIRDAIVGRGDSPGFLADVGRAPNSIAELLNGSAPSGVQPYNRDTHLGWRGPYLISQGGSYTISGAFTSSFGNNGDSAILDPWHNPIIIQRLVVAGGILYFIDQTGFSNNEGTVSGIPDGDYTRLISAGPNGILETAVTDPTAASRGDDIVLFLSYADTHP